MFGSVRWNDHLMQRYGQLDPHQCGYPRTADFTTAIAPLDLLRALRDSRKAQRPLSLAVQLPLLPHDELTLYIADLEREIDLLACHLGEHPRVERLQLNAGRASLDQLRRLVGHLQSRFELNPHEPNEFSVEVELAHADWPLVGVLRELGFNQLSVSVPDLHADLGNSVEYFQSTSRIRALIEAARTLHYLSVNVDLGYGRSWQTPTSFARKLDSIIELQPDRVSMFDYRQLPAPASRRLSLAPADVTQALHRCGIERLAAAGYRFIGLGHFALPHDELTMAQELGCLRHDIGGYTTLAQFDHLGLGAGAVSRVGDLYVRNHSSIADYRQALAQAQLPTDRGLLPASVDRGLRAIIEQLLCDGYLDFTSLQARAGVVFQERFATLQPLLEQLQREGLLHLRAHGIEIQPDGCLLIPALCAVLAQPGLADRLTDALSSADSASLSAR
ncbi:oxygen-independent coproporphyrinogen III oxidase [Stutzerimonas degradans]|uniref:coproporphyrinogen III oxidase n=2 Tax=Stutzerimonas degradans TaxID=2968968 RepID=UPI0028D35ED7|nr:coproporphyrinogen III oxidase [Stutzerimonas degradans]